MVGNSTKMVEKSGEQQSSKSSEFRTISLRNKNDKAANENSQKNEELLPEFSLQELGKERNDEANSAADAVTPRPFLLKNKMLLKKSFRRGDKRCKYCRRRLLYHSSTMQNSRNRGCGSSLSTFPPKSVVATAAARRTIENPVDAVAWVCGRLWCSVRRGKIRRVRSLHHERKKVKIDEAFCTLREILPPAAQSETDKDSEAAKVSTLRLAASYIQALSDLLKDTHLSDKYSANSSTSSPESGISLEKTRTEPKDYIIAKSEDNRALVNKLVI